MRGYMRHRIISTPQRRAITSALFPDYYLSSLLSNPNGSLFLGACALRFSNEPIVPFVMKRIERQYATILTEIYMK
jgi:hypothetical protein